MSTGSIAGTRALADHPIVLRVVIIEGRVVGMGDDLIVIVVIGRVVRALPLVGSMIIVAVLRWIVVERRVVFSACHAGTAMIVLEVVIVRRRWRGDGGLAGAGIKMSAGIAGCRGRAVGVVTDGGVVVPTLVVERRHALVGIPIVVEGVGIAVEIRAALRLAAGSVRIVAGIAGAGMLRHGHRTAPAFTAGISHRAD